MKQVLVTGSIILFLLTSCLGSPEESENEPNGNSSEESENEPNGNPSGESDEPNVSHCSN